MIRRYSLVLFAILATRASAAPILIASYNESAQPNTASYGFYSIGWIWEPQVSFQLSRIETRFAYNNKPVGIEVYNGDPTSGGTLVASANYNAVGGTWGGADLGPVSLLAGRPYLIGFTNVLGLGTSFTEDVGSTVFGKNGLIHYDTDTDPPASYVQTYVGQANAIIRIYGTVPEPSSIALTSIFAFAAFCRRRR